jgi:CheY-like chemotaxis protein
MLAGTTGIDLAGRLRSDGLAQAPMIAMSASRAMLGKARASGLFDDFLPKPFDLDQLERIIARNLARVPYG